MAVKKSNAAGAKPAATSAAMPAAVQELGGEIDRGADLSEVNAADIAISMPIDGLIDAHREWADRDLGEGGPRPGLRVTGPVAGRRRAGRAFGPEPVDIPLLDLSEDDLRALDADPMLSVSLIQIEGLPEGGAEGSGGR